MVECYYDNVPLYYTKKREQTLPLSFLESLTHYM